MLGVVLQDVTAYGDGTIIGLIPDKLPCLVTVLTQGYLGHGSSSVNDQERGFHLFNIMHSFP